MRKDDQQTHLNRNLTVISHNAHVVIQTPTKYYHKVYHHSPHIMCLWSWAERLISNQRKAKLPDLTITTLNELFLLYHTKDVWSVRHRELMLSLSVISSSPEGLIPETSTYLAWCDSGYGGSLHCGYGCRCGWVLPVFGTRILPYTNGMLVTVTASQRPEIFTNCTEIVQYCLIR